MMAAKNTSNSKIKGNTNNITLNDTVGATLLSNEKSSVVEDVEKGLKLNDEQPTKIKFETGVLNEVDNVLGNKASMTSLKILKTATTARKITIKKEITSNEESASKVPAYTPTPIKLVRTINMQASEVNSNNTESVNETSSDANKKGGSNVIRLSVKDLSDEERRKLRAKRFNIIVADSSLNVKKTITTNAHNPIDKGISTSANNPTPTFDILKKRAERFGENVSTVMKSLDHKEKLLKRKLKFLESVTNLKEVEIKKKRAERFRMV